MARVSPNTWRWTALGESAPVWPGFHQSLGQIIGQRHFQGIPAALPFLVEWGGC